MVSQKFVAFEEDIKPVVTTMVAASLELYSTVIARFLPTPNKTHYIFNLRDISKVIQLFAYSN